MIIMCLYLKNNVIEKLSIETKHTVYNNNKKIK